MGPPPEQGQEVLPPGFVWPAGAGGVRVVEVSLGGDASQEGCKGAFVSTGQHLPLLCPLRDREGMPASAPLDPSLPGCPWSSSPLQALLSLDPWPRGLQNVALLLLPCALLPGPADGSLHRAPVPTPASLQVPPARGSARAGRAVPGPSAALGSQHGPLADMMPDRLVPRCQSMLEEPDALPPCPLWSRARGGVWGQTPRATWYGHWAPGPRAPYPLHEFVEGKQLSLQPRSVLLVPEPGRDQPG